MFPRLSVESVTARGSYTPTSSVPFGTLSSHDASLSSTQNNELSPIVQRLASQQQGPGSTVLQNTLASAIARAQQGQYGSLRVNARPS
jgi:hypothetical protein